MINSGKDIFIISGLARHGKDTACEILRDNFNLNFKSSSQAALDIFLFDVLNNKYGKNYKTKQEAFEDRVNNRELWHREIALYNADSGYKLAHGIFKDNDIYCGMRSIRELEATKAWANVVGKRLHTIWVDASLRFTELTETAESIDITSHDCEYILLNNYGLDELYNECYKLITYLSRKNTLDMILARGIDYLVDAEYTEYRHDIKPLLYEALWNE